MYWKYNNKYFERDREAQNWVTFRYISHDVPLEIQ